VTVTTGASGSARRGTCPRGSRIRSGGRKARRRQASTTSWATQDGTLSRTLSKLICGSARNAAGSHPFPPCSQRARCRCRRPLRRTSCRVFENVVQVTRRPEAFSRSGITLTPANGVIREWDYAKALIVKGVEQAAAGAIIADTLGRFHAQECADVEPVEGAIDGERGRSQVPLAAANPSPCPRRPPRSRPLAAAVKGLGTGRLLRQPQSRNGPDGPSSFVPTARGPRRGPQSRDERAMCEMGGGAVTPLRRAAPATPAPGTTRS